MLQVNPSLTPAQVKAILNGTGRTLDKLYANPFGPMLDSFAAVTAAQVPASGPKLVANRLLNFGNIDRGKTSGAQRVNVFNIGVGPLNLKAVQPKPGSSSDFKITSQSSISTGRTRKGACQILADLGADKLCLVSLAEALSRAVTDADCRVTL